MNKEYTEEQRNLGLFSNELQKPFNNEFIKYEELTETSIGSILNEINSSLIFTREYEHAVGCINAINDKLSISYLRMPHPSGIGINNKNVYIFSTRTPHMLYELELLFSESSEDSKKSLLMPKFIRILPGSLYAHEVLVKNDIIYFNATGWNEIHRINIDLKSSPEVYYSPSFIKDKKPNCSQINSITFDDETSYSSCFSYIDSKFKPWKDNIGPLNKGGIIRHKDSKVIIKNLTCPHSVRACDTNLYFCNSGFGEINRFNFNDNNYSLINKLPGFTRGLAITTNYLFVGLSKVQKGRDSYAPGLKSKDSLCGIAVINRKNNKIETLFHWPNGKQIFDIQILPNEIFKKPRFPQSRENNSLEPSIDFFNW